MRGLMLGVSLVYLGLAINGCVTVALAPGADQVKLAKNAADVATCKAVGNVEGIDPESQAATPGNSLNQMKNQAIGLGGDTIFLTVEAGYAPVKATGVAYHCGRG